MKLQRKVMGGILLALVVAGAAIQVSPASAYKVTALLDPIGVVLGFLAWILFFFGPLCILLCVLFELHDEVKGGFECLSTSITGTS